MNDDTKQVLAESLTTAIQALQAMATILTLPEGSVKPTKSRRKKKGAEEEEEDEVSERILDGEIDDQGLGAILVRPEPVIFAGTQAIRARKRGELKNTFVDDPRVGREYAQKKTEKRKYVPVPSRRPKEKISVKCNVCGRPHDIYPSELSISIGDKGETPSFRCNGCSKGR